MTPAEASAVLARRWRASITTQRQMVAASVVGFADSPPQPRAARAAQYLDQDILTLWVLWEVEHRALVGGWTEAELGPVY